MNMCKSSCRSRLRQLDLHIFIQTQSGNRDHSQLVDIRVLGIVHARTFVCRLDFNTSQAIDDSSTGLYRLSLKHWSDPCVSTFRHYVVDRQYFAWHITGIDLPHLHHTDRGTHPRHRDDHRLVFGGRRRRGYDPAMGDWSGFRPGGSRIDGHDRIDRYDIQHPCADLICKNIQIDAGNKYLNDECHLLLFGHE